MNRRLRHKPTQLQPTDLFFFFYIFFFIFIAMLGGVHCGIYNSSSNKKPKTHTGEKITSSKNVGKAGYPHVED
jgi:hypothetical protein